MFRNLNLQTRLIGAFLIVGLLVFLVALVGWGATSRLSANIDTLASNTLTSVTGLWKIQDGQTQIMLAEHSLANHDFTMDERQDFLKLVRQAWHQIDLGFSQYESAPRSPQEEELYQQFLGKFKIWRAERDRYYQDNQELLSRTVRVLPEQQYFMILEDYKTLEKAKQDKRLEAFIEHTLSVNEQSWMESRKALQTIIEFQEKLGTSTQDISRLDVSQTRFWVLAAMLGGPFTAILFGLLLSEKMARPIDDTIKSMIRELELSRDTLEERVRARTDELTQALSHLRQTQTQLIQTEKMSSLGQMVAGIAHEINNPINFIHGNLTYVEDYSKDFLNLIQLYQKYSPEIHSEIEDYTQDIDLNFLVEDLPKTIASMRVGTERIRSLVLTLRNFSRLDEAEMKPAQIHEGIESTLVILQNQFKGKPGFLPIKLIKEYADLPAIECYPGQLNQVFMNLLSNAIDALYDYRNLQTEITQLPTIWIRTQLLKNERVRIRIKDNGSGMTDAVKTRLFDPFFTTKPVGEGTGLGLSISYQIVVDKHKGELRYVSEPGQGAEFIVEIPLRQSR